MNRERIRSSSESKPRANPLGAKAKLPAGESDSPDRPPRLPRPASRDGYFTVITVLQVVDYSARRTSFRCPSPPPPSPGTFPPAEEARAKAAGGDDGGDGVCGGVGGEETDEGAGGGGEGGGAGGKAR
jgi:hypothetical protein